MCGIAGIVDSEIGATVEQSIIHQMCEVITHRGPDDEGIYARAGVGLGMRRLSIIDVAGGHQPVFNEDKSIWIVFNGEIYNFPELRPGLEKRGHRFYTHSDTEVIVHLYEEMGPACISQLRGMFGLALYDARQRKLLLARDRLGKKPLHYALQGLRLLFGSEIKSILTAAPELAQVNNEALLQYMYYGYVPDPLTAFTTIHKLPPGHLLEFHDGKIDVRQYWNLPEYGTAPPRSEEQYLDEMEHLLAEAVRIRLISEVPLGALLSGGTDSSTVVGLMARASSKPVKTFSIGFRNEDFNEAQYAAIVAKHFGTDHHELVVDPDILETVDKLTSSLEEPFGDSSMLPTYFVSQMARKYVTVALSGDGGDEIFAGYDRYAIHLRRKAFERIPAWARKAYRDGIYPLLPADMRGRKFSYNVSLPWRERYVDSMSFLPSFERDIPLLSDDFRSLLVGSNPENVIFQLFDEAPAKDPISEMLYVDTKSYMVGDILTKVDRMSMLTSLEVRVPILDHVFVEWATGLPAEWKLRNGRQKYLLRKLAERIGVPREALDRPKQGFAIPLVHWIRYELKDLILSVLLDSRTLQRGYFNAKAIRKLLDEHFRERRDRSEGIWRLLMFELWHRNYLEKIGANNLVVPPHDDAARTAEIMG
ncbi:MAG TPA: asparagine synthase (glutamine-hydrolyzing) [Candidatus Sulfotelmatobacter sp.]|nr:asparagine synthase (glutamine-hydrolyzing) [Candidatus Sulfotelmatobacter sp.]